MTTPVTVTVTNKPRITRRHIATVTLLALGYAGYYFCRSDFSVALPLIVAEQARGGIPASVAQVRLGSIASLGVLAYAIGKFPSGGLADRFGGRRNFLGGMAGSVFFSLLFMLGGGFPIFTLAWVGNRAVQSLGWTGMVKITSRWFSFSTYGTVMAVLSLSYLFGDAISREIMSVLLAHGVGWRGLFAAGAGILFVLFAANLFFLRETPEELGLASPEENPLNLFAGEQTVRPGTAAIFRQLLRSPTFWLVCIVSLCATLLRETFNLWTPLYFSQAVGLSDARAASSSALFPLFGGLSVIVAGVLSDKLGPRGRGLILSTGLLLTAGALLALSRVPLHVQPLLPIALVTLVAFLLLGPYSYLAGAISLDFGGKQGCATAAGIIDGIGYLAGVLSGNTMAHLTVSHGWASMFLLLAAVALLSSAVAGISLWLQHQPRAKLA